MKDNVILSNKNTRDHSHCNTKTVQIIYMFLYFALNRLQQQKYLREYSEIIVSMPRDEDSVLASIQFSSVKGCYGNTPTC